MLWPLPAWTKHFWIVRTAHPQIPNCQESRPSRHQQVHQTNSGREVPLLGSRCARRCLLLREEQRWVAGSRNADYLVILNFQSRAAMRSLVNRLWRRVFDSVQ